MHLPTRQLVRKGPAFIGIVFALSAGLHGQSSTPPPAVPPSTSSSSATTSSVSDEKVTQLEKYTVSDVPITEQILPTVRPIGSVYGDDTDILDIPRSVSSVNAAWMEDRQVKNAMDFGQFSPGVYSSANYGIPGVPQIRGDEAQIYVDGQLMPFSRNSTSLSFNGVEAMDIVKGPGTAVYGPQGNGPGGYVNFVSKQPYFDQDHIDFSATLGTWTSGHSYGDPQYTLDFGGPITDKLAYRVSYNARYGDEYYVGAKDETQDVYVAMTYRATHSLKFEWWAQGFADRTNEINGANRVTQNLIWNGSYIAGPTIPGTSGYAYDTYLPSDPPPSFTNYPSGLDGAYQIVDPAQAHTVKLPAYDALVGPDDTARSKLFQSQLKTTYDINSTSSIVNTAYYALEHSNKFETYGYDEWVPRNLDLQDRTEYHAEFDMGPVVNTIITGVDYRFQYIRSGDDYTMEPFTYYDLGQPLNNIFYPGYYIQNETWGSGLQVPGHPGYSYGEMQDTTLSDLAGFLQDNVKLTKAFSAILGFREDVINANTANPPLVVAGENPNNPQGIYPYPFETYNGYYSLPTPVYLDRGALYHYDASKVDPSYFLSLIYKLSETQSIYITYDRVDAVRGQTNFGGVDDGYEGVAQLKQDLSTASTLYETGYKGSFLNNTLYFGAALYQQYKIEPQLKGNPPDKIKTNGIELDAVYQPTKQLSINANLTYQDATAYGSFFEETGDYLDAYATTTAVDGTYGTGLGAVNYGAFQNPPYAYTPPSGKIRAPGVPALIGNLFVEYKFSHGFGVGAGPNFIGHQNADDEGLLHIPSEYEIDGYITYTPSRRWDVRLNITNLTSNRVLDPIDVSFAGNDTIFVRPPISATLTLRLHY